jgi:signal transduction histidine kinase
VLATVAPLGFAAGWSVQRVSRRQLANVNQQQVATVRAISVAVDQEVGNTTAALDVLGELHALDGPDRPVFESLAARLLPYQPNWSAVLLADADGEVLDGVPDRADGGAVAGGIPWARAASRRRAVTVSNMFHLPGTAGPFVIIAVPVVRQGRVRLVVGARVRTEAFSAILRQQQAPPNGAVSLLDGANRIVARSRDEADFLGATASTSFLEISSRTTEGAWRAVSREGVPSYAAFSRSAHTGLTVVLGRPAEGVDGPIRRIRWALAAAWIVVLGFGAGLGLLFGGAIVRALRSASRASIALARGEPVVAPPSRIAEIDDLAAGLRQAADTVQERNRERDEAGRLKDEFLMTVSHELRTPLTAIVGWARMLSSGQIDESRRPRAVEAIERNAGALRRLVDDLLDMSRIVSGKLRLDVQPVALADVLATAIDAIRPAAEAKRIQVATTIGAAGLAVPGDAGRLQQVVWNLLANAVKFTPNGGRIDIRAMRASDQIEITVTDTGTGIAPEFLPYVFDRFRQGASVTGRTHSGLGLGLAIVRHLVELHGGTVEAENNLPMPGATFRVRLPAHAAGQSAVATASARSASSSSSVSVS